jgi:tol-pal system protein YbgF
MPRRGLVRRAARALVVPALLAAVLAGPALAREPVAQDDALARIDRLAAAAEALEVQLAALGAPPPAPGIAAPRDEIVPAQGQLPQGYAAQVEVRLTQLERQISDLTGRIERLQYDQSQLGGRLDRALADIEYRLTTLEGGDPGAAPPSRGSLDSGGSTTTGSLSTGSGSLSAGSGTLGSGSGGSFDGSGAAGLGSVSGGGTLGTLSGSSGGGSTLGSGQTASAATGATGGDVMAAYDAAYGRLQRNDWAGAEQAFAAFLRDHADHPLASNAQYWLGETYYARGNYPQAATAFARGYQQFPEGAKATDSLLKLGMSLAEMGQTGDACLTFQRLLQDFPNATAAVQRRVASLQSQYGC